LKNIIFILLTLMVSPIAISSQLTSESNTANYFETIKNNPTELLNFLQKMPKGGDLHNHTGGASMAENMIADAAKDHLCINRKDDSVSLNATCSSKIY